MASTLTEPPVVSTTEPREATPIRRFTSGPLPTMLAVGLGIGLLYSPTLLTLARLWKLDPNYSHGPIVVLAAALFAWMAWQRERTANRLAVSKREISRGFALVSLGVVIHFVAWLVNQPFLDVLSLMLLLWGCCFVTGGRDAWRAYRFPAAFLLFAAPLPPLLLAVATISMQQFVAATSTLLLELAGVAVYREGYLIHLSGFTMEVGQACSGMRQLVAFAAVGAALGHLSRRSGWFMLACIAMAIVSALLANIARVLLTAVVLSLAGPKYASGVFHTLEGLLTFLLGVALLLAAALGLARWLDRGTVEEAAV